MRNTYRMGVADTRAEFLAVADFAAIMPQNYGEKRHVDWSYGKLRDRMEAGQNLAYPAMFDDIVVAVAVAHPYIREEDMAPAVEFKLWRTADHHRAWKIGIAAMQGAFNSACQSLQLAPGTSVRTHLDTRDSDAMAAFEHVGFVPVGRTILYRPEEHAPDTPEVDDVIYEKYMTVPVNLYDR